MKPKHFFVLTLVYCVNSQMALPGAVGTGGNQRFAAMSGMINDFNNNNNE